VGRGGGGRARGGRGGHRPKARRASNKQASKQAARRPPRYSRRRVRGVWALTDRLATLPESFEMARATGLTVQQVLYNAQVRLGCGASLAPAWGARRVWHFSGCSTAQRRLQAPGGPKRRPWRPGACLQAEGCELQPQLGKRPLPRPVFQTAGRV
jgi:hypothetical protein